MCSLRACLILEVSNVPTQLSIIFFTTVAEDNHGMLFNGSDIGMRYGLTKVHVHFSGLDWEYGRPQNGPEYLTTTGTSSEDVTLSVSTESLLMSVL